MPTKGSEESPWTVTQGSQLRWASPGLDYLINIPSFLQSGRQIFYLGPKRAIDVEDGGTLECWALWNHNQSPSLR